MGIFEQNTLAFFAVVALVGGAAGWAGSWLRERMNSRTLVLRKRV